MSDACELSRAACGLTAGGGAAGPPPGAEAAWALLKPDTPSLAKQKSFITDNAGNLNRETKIAILRIVTMEVGDAAVAESSNGRDVDVNLDRCAELNEDVVRHIYNMVRSRLDVLNQPLGRASSSSSSAGPLPPGRGGAGPGGGARGAAAPPPQAEAPPGQSPPARKSSKH